MLTARNSPPFDAGRWRAQAIARDMSSTSIRGRQGVPSLKTVIWPEVTAQATKSLRTRSRRTRSDMPQAVANLKLVTVVLPRSMVLSALSVPILERAYAVNGLAGSVSFRARPSECPYMLQLEAK